MTRLFDDVLFTLCYLYTGRRSLFTAAYYDDASGKQVTKTFSARRYTDSTDYYYFFQYRERGQSCFKMIVMILSNCISSFSCLLYMPTQISAGDGAGGYAIASAAAV